MKAIMRDEREMKDSGIEWIGNIPIDWLFEKLKYPIKQCDGGVWGNNASGVGDILVLRSTEQTVDGKWTIERPEARDLSQIEDYDYYLLKKGDLLITKSSGSLLHIGKTTIVNEEVENLNCCYSNFMQRLRLIETVSPEYFWYILNSDIAKKQFEYLSNTTNGINNLNVAIISNIFVPLPSYQEQNIIANYLDDRCSKIDTIIAEAKASIEEYKELKQAVIYEAVTKGLDKNVEMKDSGIEWLGSIPSQWNLVKTNRIIDNTQNGLTRRDLDKSDGQIVLKLKNINAEGEIDYSDTNRIQLTDDEIEKYRLHNGDLLFVRVNGSRDLVGKCAIFEEKKEAIAYNDHIIRVKLNDYCIPEFVKWYLLCDSGKSEIALKINTAAGQFTISGEGLRAIYMPLPSLNEQREIVDFLDNKTKKIDFIINEKQSLIEDLESYKKSLIYEVVTGKRKVVE